MIFYFIFPNSMFILINYFDNYQQFHNFQSQILILYVKTDEVVIENSFYKRSF